jgi:hypothetical protein
MIVGGEKGADDSIDELVGGQSLRMVFESATTEQLAGASEKIAAIEGIEEISSLHDSAGFTLKTTSGASVGAALFELARQESWTVSEIAVNRRSLEDVFREVTTAATHGGEA